MDQNTWDQRYGQEAFVYGKAPNEFFAQEIRELRRGKILLPCEGEGRNAIYAAQLKWEVDAFDFSEKGKAKAEALAEELGVSISNFWVTPAEEFDPGTEQYDAIALIYCHVSPDIRHDFHQKMIKALKPGGALIFEAFSEDQLNYDSGGPPVSERLFSLQSVKKEFKGLNFQILNKSIIDLQEGEYHKGEASVIRMFGNKA